MLSLYQFDTIKGANQVKKKNEERVLLMHTYISPRSSTIFQSEFDRPRIHDTVVLIPERRNGDNGAFDYRRRIFQRQDLP